MQNEIAIEIDTLQCNSPWAVEIDWGTIQLRPSLKYRLFFIHGWTGNENTFADFYNFAIRNGYEAFAPKNYSNGIAPMITTAMSITEEIFRSVSDDGDKVFVVAHSRGGLFLRGALRTYPQLAAKVAGYVTLSTPHHGVDGVRNFLGVEHLLAPEGFPGIPCGNVDDINMCMAAARSMTREAMRRFNYGDDCADDLMAPLWHWENGSCLPQWNEQEAAGGYSVVGTFGDVDAQTATFPWDAANVPFPNWPNVDKQFWGATHQNIQSNEDVYRYTIDLFDSRKQALDFQQASAAATEQVAAAPPQLTFFTSGTIEAGQVQSVAAQVAAATTASFLIITQQPSSVTLAGPMGEVIDPNTPTNNPQVLYSVIDPDTEDITPVWYYLYS